MNQIFQYPQKTFLPKKKKHFYISLTELGFFIIIKYLYYFVRQKVFKILFYSTFLFLCFN